jgi:hypothetical protein
VLIAKCTFAHVCEFDRPFRAGIHEPIATLRVEFCCSDNLCKFFHICRLDVHNIEALILNVEVPQIDSEVIATNKRLAITVDRYTVDMICVSICVGSPWDRSHDSIMMGHARHLQGGCTSKDNVTWSGCSTSSYSRRCEITREIVFSHDFQGLLKDLPKFYCLVIGGEEVM